MDYNTLMDCGLILEKEMNEQSKKAYTPDEKRIQIEANKIILNTLNKIYKLAEEAKNND